jgi:hypothetical protein
MGLLNWRKSKDAAVVDEAEGAAENGKSGSVFEDDDSLALSAYSESGTEDFDKSTTPVENEPTPEDIMKEAEKVIEESRADDAGFAVKIHEPHMYHEQNPQDEEENEDDENLDKELEGPDAARRKRRFIPSQLKVIPRFRRNHYISREALRTEEQKLLQEVEDSCEQHDPEILPNEDSVEEYPSQNEENQVVGSSVPTAKINGAPSEAEFQNVEVELEHSLTKVGARRMNTACLADQDNRDEESDDGSVYSRVSMASRISTASMRSFRSIGSRLSLRSFRSRLSLRRNKRDDSDSESYSNKRGLFFVSGLAFYVVRLEVLIS